MGHDTIWRSRRPAEKLAAETINVSEELGGGALLVNPGGVPDWVRDPYGNDVRVRALFLLDYAKACAKCGAPLPIGQEVLAAEVHGDTTALWVVYACPASCGFVWEQRHVLPLPLR